MSLQSHKMALLDIIELNCKIKYDIVEIIRVFGKIGNWWIQLTEVN